MRRLLSLVSPLILCLAAGLLVSNWDALPERWPVHWGPGGQPNGWSTHTPGSAGMPLLLGLFIWLGMEALAWRVELRRVDLPQVEPARTQALAAATADLIRMCTVATCSVLALVAAGLPLHPEWGSSSMFPLVLVGGMLAMIGGAIAIFYVRANALPMPEGYSALVYSNPKDRRLWVPKLLGLGWTLNFAHPLAWPVMLLLLGVIAGLSALAMHR